MPVQYVRRAFTGTNAPGTNAISAKPALLRAVRYSGGSGTIEPLNSAGSHPTHSLFSPQAFHATPTGFGDGFPSSYKYSSVSLGTRGVFKCHGLPIDQVPPIGCDFSSEASEKEDGGSDEGCGNNTEG